MAYWLMKTEPGDYSWERLNADGETEWDGVRNHQAARNMRSMRKGDRVFFYRSVVQPAILGVMRVSAESFPDPDDERWVRVKVRPELPFAEEVSLRSIKMDPRLEGIALVRQSRLSVMPISEEHWAVLCAMGGIEP
ncbi:EVE domain-containing protein [Geminicoccaceae bacterium 1502E]|nr:EVE domain-containing protein [Geminicoccaceae bacterium 1502E]